MSDGDDPETGGQLRQKLEEALQANKALAERLAGHEAKAVIEAKGYRLVTAEDLKGVDLDSIAAKAEELEGAKRADLGRLFQAKGVPVDEVPQAIDEFLAGPAKPAPKSDLYEGLGQIGAAGAAVRKPPLEIDLSTDPVEIFKAAAAKK